MMSLAEKSQFPTCGEPQFPFPGSCNPRILLGLSLRKPKIGSREEQLAGHSSTPQDTISRLGLCRREVSCFLSPLFLHLVHPTSNSAGSEATWEGGREQNAEGEKSQLSPAPLVISWLKQAGAREGEKLSTG